MLPTLEVGGTEYQVSLIMAALAARGWEIRVRALLHRGALAQELGAAGVQVKGANRLWMGSNSRARQMSSVLCGLPGLLADLAWWRPRVVHAFLPLATLCAGACWTVLRSGRLVSSRRSLNLYQRSHPMSTRLERWLHRYHAALVANSAAVAADLVSEGAARERVHIIRNGVDIAAFEAPVDRVAVRRELGIADNAFMVIKVANLLRYKGHADLLDALAGASPRLPYPWTLVLVGADGDCLRPLQRRAQRLGIQANVLWCGSRRDVPRLLAAADLACHVSHEEGSPNAVIEAMAAGLPLVLTDAGGSAEVIGDGEAGELVPVSDVNAIGNAIVTLAANPARRRALGARGRERARRLYALDACVGAHEDLYRALGAVPTSIPAFRE